MENASNALLMAAGILVAMLVIAVAIVLFTQYGNLGNTYATKMSEQEVIKFNNNFTVFEGRTNITASEIASLVNFTTEYRQQTDIEVTVTCRGSDLSDLTKFIKEESTDDLGNIIYFTCSSIAYEGPFGMVNLITFTKSR